MSTVPVRASGGVGSAKKGTESRRKEGASEGEGGLEGRGQKKNGNCECVCGGVIEKVIDG